MAATRRPPLRAQIVVLVVAALVAGAGAVIWSRTVAGQDETIRLGDPEAEVDPGSTNPPQVGEQLPVVELMDESGAAVVLEPDGRPMVVNLWHRNCGPCARELQFFAAAAAESGDQVRFVGVNPLDEADQMVEFAATRGVGYELLRDTEFALVDGLGLLWYPATLFVSAEGEIIAQTGEISEAELRAHVHHLLM